jgi:tyrosinase
VVLAAMRSSNFSVGSGGGTTTLAPETGAAPNAARATTTPTTLILEGVKLIRRPPAPLSVFLNLPKGTTPELNGPYYVGTLNLFNFDLGTGGVMMHSDDSAPMPMPGAEVRFDIAELLAQQRARGLWDGGPVTVTITTIGADTPGTVTYVTVANVELVP